MVRAAELLDQRNPHFSVRFKLPELERIENVPQVTGDQDFAPQFFLSLTCRRRKGQRRREQRIRSPVSGKDWSCVAIGVLDEGARLESDGLESALTNTSSSTNQS